ncbi:MAG: type II toxin-antitoxin system PemK/MazF family toxin [Synergistaceae bacterium]|nr:type II toxin-antitoxin system PemK/MazF family toxin [Synergistaceae bacterium]
MARKNHRKKYHSRRLSADLFRLTKNTGVTALSVSAGNRKKETLTNNATARFIHAVAAQPSVTRPARPQGVDDPRIVRGSVWFADLAPRSTSDLITSVQSGTRPVLVISNDLNNRFGSVLTVIPFTGSLKRLDMPTHVTVVPSDVRNGYQPSEIYESTLLCEQATALDKVRLVSYVGTVVSQRLMEQVETALLTQVGISQTRRKQKNEAFQHEN